MHSSYFFALAAAPICAAAAAAQSPPIDIGALPSCAQYGILSELVNSQCALTDIDCFCKDASLWADLGKGIQENCNSKDAALASSVGQAICSRATATTAPATTTTVSPTVIFPPSTTPAPTTATSVSTNSVIITSESLMTDATPFPSYNKSILATATGRYNFSGTLTPGAKPSVTESSSAEAGLVAPEFGSWRWSFVVGMAGFMAFLFLEL